MDIVERIEEIQDSCITQPCDLDDLFSVDVASGPDRTTIDTSSLQDFDGIFQMPSDSSRFMGATLINPSNIDAGIVSGELNVEEVRITPTLEESHSHDLSIDADSIMATGTIYLDSISPFATRYVQLTQEDYDTMLERISSLEQRLIALERRL